ncbi:hypothetical protein FHW88_002998 [Mucilaginibacter sp. SG538B]|uniref:Imm52 family immunity protein n=1 Tax=Mucilaginibacter sp. SG538B TaxID=2587021 RepID=UPI00159D5821|nr:Imm52 family immunity protein [Mucilaginibacter sp. SG538B]NVM64709.1 hypothetical protein [Mucilaginibacter sp. SG538B]
MIDTFYIGAYWKDRKQLLDSVIDPTVQTLKRLCEIDEHFLNLYELGMSRKQALECRVSLSPEYIKKLYQGGLKKNDLDQNGYSKIGYRLSLWTGHKDGEASNVSFGVGKSSERLSNVCLIEMPAEGPARDRLLTLAKVKQIMKVLIENWQPDVVVLNSKELSNALDVGNDIGWVTYRKGLKSKIKLKSDIITQVNFIDGYLFYLNSDVVYNYDLMNSLAALK